jgi:hypothetical protein
MRRMYAYTETDEGAPSLRSLQGREAMLLVHVV